MGNWIGGDRDGNPNVGADTLRMALARQAETALRFYLTEVHELGAELSISHMLAPVTPEMLALAERSPDHNAHRERRALPARADRHVCAAGGHAARAHRHRGAAPRGGAAERRTPTRPSSSPTCASIEASLQSHHAQALIAPRLAPLMRAVQVFGFHLATVDLRQSSDKHEAVIAELLRVARIEPDYGALDEAAAPRAAAAAAQRRAAAARARRRLFSDWTRGELAIFETAREMRAALRRARRCATTSSRTPKT